MMLSLLGLTTKRSAALRLFNLNRSNPEYSGATHLEISCVFARVAEVRRCRWEYHNRFNFASISESLRAQLRDSGYPTLLSFGAVHKNGNWRCTHVVVAVNATDEFIDLLDPLGKKPQTLAAANVRLKLVDGPQRVRVIGNSYTVDFGAEAFVLRWKVRKNRVPK